MLLFTAIFFFFKLTTLQGNYAEEISGRLDKTFSCKQNRNSKQSICNFVDPDLGIDKEDPKE